MQLAIGLVHGGTVHACCLQSLLRTMFADLEGPRCINGRFLERASPGGMMHVAQNELTEEFMSHPDQPDAILKVDSDMAWTPDDVWTLRETAMRTGYPIVSGVVPYPNNTAGACVPMMRDAQMRLIEPGAERLVRVFCAAFTLVHRDVYLKLAQAHPGPTPYYNYEHWHGKAAGEDVIFAQRVKDLGIPVFVDTEVRIGHRKMHTFESAVPRVAVSC